ncbi:MAG: FtsH protease activity modulator HflK, partial [Alphaproteobacteria bacterium]|nr:FtsH protease activity modulator HflK [Alphaproteobacteria bacterium]
PSGQKPSSGGNEPDLEDLLRQAHDRFGNMFNSKSPGDGLKGIGIIFILILVLWLGTGFYRVQPGENAVLLTFGKWTSTRGEAGLGYRIPWPVQTVTKVDVAFDRRVIIGFQERGVSGKISDISSESQMLTGDENIVDIDFVVMWKISDAKKYLFQIREPENTVKKVSESAMREIIGRSQIQKALTEGRADIEVRCKDLMQRMLDDYQSGIVINTVQLLRVNPPSSVVDAFDDVQRARTDRERIKNEAETYRNDIVPRARGEAQKLLQDAEAYKEAVLSKAKGEAGRFLSVYKAYVQSKDVTTRRIYIETMQRIMQNSKKVIVSSSGNGGTILPYLSLDQLKG